MPRIDQIPALLRVAIVFVIILLAIRKKSSLGSAFLLGAAILGLLFGLSPLAIVKSAFLSVIYPQTLSLAIIVSLILVLSNSMETAKQMRRLLDRFRGIVANPKLNLIIFPALIGLLPMPGGAVFSAPMVKEMGSSSRLSADQLSFINYWFRHIWEYWWPMYPGVLLATLMADVNLLVFVVVMCPLTAVALTTGWWPIKNISHSQPAGEKLTRAMIQPFVKELLPILIAIIPGLGLGVLLSNVLPDFPIGKETGLIIALCLSIVWVWHANRFPKVQMVSMIKHPHNLKMMYMVFAILIFKGVITDSQAVTGITDEMLALQIPLVLITVALPFIVGLVAGFNSGFVGGTFPILISLILSHGEAGFMLAYMMLALTCGFAGVLLSPLHLCMILSNEYFSTPAGPVYRFLMWPCIFLMISSLGYFWVLHWLI